jgi:ribosomal protein S18 acetylase RimI-like enzyme
MTTLDGMRIRPATPDDLPAINDVHLACGRPPWNGPIAADHQERLVVVALADDAIVGAGKTHFQAQPDAAAPAGHYLGGLSVHPDHRRRGLGLALTRVRIDWVWERADAVYYFTDEENGASIRMHAGLGFQEIGRHPTLLGARANREDLVLFRADRLA